MIAASSTNFHTVKQTLGIPEPLDELWLGGWVRINKDTISKFLKTKPTRPDESLRAYCLRCVGFTVNDADYNDDGDDERYEYRRQDGLHQALHFLKENFTEIELNKFKSDFGFEEKFHGILGFCTICWR